MSPTLRSFPTEFRRLRPSDLCTTHPMCSSPAEQPAIPTPDDSFIRSTVICPLWFRIWGIYMSGFPAWWCLGSHRRIHWRDGCLCPAILHDCDRCRHCSHDPPPLRGWQLKASHCTHISNRPGLCQTSGVIGKLFPGFLDSADVLREPQAVTVPWIIISPSRRLHPT